MGVPPLFYVPPPISLQSPSPSLTPHVVREELPCTQIVASHTAIHRAVIWGGGFKHRGGLHPHPCGFCTPPPLTPSGFRGLTASGWRCHPWPHPTPVRGQGGVSGSPSSAPWSRWSLKGCGGVKLNPGGGQGGGIRMGGQQRFLLTGHNDGGLLVELHAVDFLQAVYRVGTVGWMLWGGARPTAPPPPPPPAPPPPHPLPPSMLTPACPRYLRTTCPLATSQSTTALSEPQEQIWLLSKDLGRAQRLPSGSGAAP